MHRVHLIASAVFISWIAEVSIHNLATQESLIALKSIEAPTYEISKYGAIFGLY